MTIIITKMPLKVSKEEAFAMVKTEESLVGAIINQGEKLKQNGVEIFIRNGNCLVTSDGYYFAFYKEDLKLVE